MFGLDQPVGPFPFARKAAAADGGDLDTNETMNSNSLSKCNKYRSSARWKTLADGAMIRSGLFKLAV